MFHTLNYSEITCQNNKINGYQEHILHVQLPFFLNINYMLCMLCSNNNIEVLVLIIILIGTTYLLTLLCEI